MISELIPLPTIRTLCLRKPNLTTTRTGSRLFTDFKERFTVFGIETSCDDTGCAVVDSQGTLLGEALNNQMQFHHENGGIIPPVAGRMHRENMVSVADKALAAAGVSMSDIDAVAATVKPGMHMSLEVGAKYGCHLSRQWKKPFIPIHHMEAHALTARMFDKTVNFPFLSLLISGGHCLLVLVQNTDSFLVIGKTLDCSPGEVLDKAARRMKLRNIPALQRMSGGQAVETMALQAKNPTEFDFVVPLVQDQNCDFSFTGMRTRVERYIDQEEKKFSTEADAVIDSASNLCASLQLVMARHFCNKLGRAMSFLEERNMIPEKDKSLVVSGGVACNQFFARALKLVCDLHHYNLSIPPAKYCNDNGVMIAWNGVERYRENKGILHWNHLESVEVQPRCPIGTDIRHLAQGSSVKSHHRLKLKEFLPLFHNH